MSYDESAEQTSRTGEFRSGKNTFKTNMNEEFLIVSSI